MIGGRGAIFELLSAKFAVPLAQAANEPVWQRLPPARRAMLLMALLGLILLGLLLALIAVAGGRLARRLARHRPDSRQYEEDEWFRRGATKAGDEDLPPEGDPDEDVRLDEQ